MTTPYPAIEHKAGATFSLTGTCLLPAGTWSATCEARHPITEALVQTFAVTLTPLGVPTAEASHAILIQATADQSAAWPRGPLECDVRYAGADGIVLATSSFMVDVIKRVTRNA